MKAIWKQQILAESDETVVVEGNHYFPVSSLQMKYFTNSEHSSRCPWKGEAKYYSIIVDDEKNENAAWYYPQPKQAAIEIKDRVAFWKGIEIVE